jgi:hypothetical protein
VRRLLLVAVTFFGVITEAETADAKGPTEATLTAAWMDAPIEVAGVGELHPFWRLPMDTGLFAQLGGQEATGQITLTGRLGPWVVVEWRMCGERCGDGGRLRQVLYPSAEDGPLVRTPPGQAFMGVEPFPSGWHTAEPALAATLRALGVTTAPVPVHDGGGVTSEGSGGRGSVGSRRSGAQ